jgi:hypothetical protein
MPTGSQRSMTDLQESSTSPFEDRQDHPHRETTRDEFYETFENLRYLVKVHLAAGQQTENLAVDIEDLISLQQDILAVFDSRTDIGVTIDEHTYWTARLQSTGELATQTDWRAIESEIESIAEEHGLALRKTISMGGRGYTKKGYRSVMVSYSFGSSSDFEESVSDKHSPIGRIEWVGGPIGRPEDLEPQSLELKSVEENKNKSLIQRVRQKLSL